MTKRINQRRWLENKKLQSRKVDNINDPLNDDSNFDKIKVFEDVDEGFEENKHQSIYMGNIL